MENNEKVIRLKDEKLQDVNGGNEYDEQLVPTGTPIGLDFPDISEDEWKKLQQQLAGACTPIAVPGSGSDKLLCSRPGKAGTLDACKDCPYMKQAGQNK